MNKYLRFLFDSKYRFFTLNDRGAFTLVSDSTFLKMQFRARMHQKLNLDNPTTFNEKLQWLKINNRKSLHTEMADKYSVRKIVKERIGDEYLIPLVGGPWQNFDDINFGALPNQFVLKCTHDSGGLIICNNKATFNFIKSKIKITTSLTRNYYYHNREWPYKNIEPKIIAEKLMIDSGNDFLPVYKFFCFHGVPHIIQTIQNDKQVNETIDYFDTSWNILELKQNYPNSKKPLNRPNCLEKMLSIVSQLAPKDEPFIRVDLYVINDKIYFSEYTFFSDGGLEEFHPEEWDQKLGSLISLPAHILNNTSHHIV